MTSRQLLSILTKTGISGFAYAATGLIAGPVGAKVMQDAGHAGYSLLESAEAGAAGGASVGITIGLLKELWTFIDDKYHITSGEDGDFHHEHNILKKLNLKAILVELLISPATLAVAGAIGHEMLIKVAHMSLQMTIAALAIGEAILAAPFMLLGLCCFCCCMLLLKDERQTNAATQQNSDLRNSFGAMWKREVANQDQGDKQEAAPAAGVSVPAPAASPV